MILVCAQSEAMMVPLVALLFPPAALASYQSIDATLVNRTCNTGYLNDVAGLVDYWWFMHCAVRSVPAWLTVIGAVRTLGLTVKI